LVFPSSSKFDLNFKIAYLGSTRFNDRLNSVGTLTNTGHELSHEKSFPTPKEVSGTARAWDVWSLGCVFLEAAEWSIFGLRNHQSRKPSKDILKRKPNLLKQHRRNGGKWQNGTTRDTIGKVLEMTERMLEGDVDTPELFDWHNDVLKEIHSQLATSSVTAEGDYAIKWTSDRRTTASPLDEHFTRNPVVDPYGGRAIASTKSGPVSLYRSFLSFFVGFRNGRNDRNDSRGG